jgi:hypothetical protein
MPGLSPSQDTGYPDWSLAWFELDLPAKCQFCTSLRLWQLPSKYFQILCCITYPTIWHYIAWYNISTIKKSSFPCKHYEGLRGGDVVAPFTEPQRKMEVNGQHHAPSTIHPEKEPLLPSEHDFGWASQLVWTFSKWKHLLHLPGFKPWIIQPVS